MRALRVDNDADYLQLDAATLANLEVVESRDAARPRATLWGVVNATRSAMGDAHAAPLAHPSAEVRARRSSTATTPSTS